MPQNGQPWTQEDWEQAQQNNPEQWGNYQAISGDQYGEEQQGWWQNVQQVGEAGTPGSGLYGLAGEGDMPGMEQPISEPTPESTPEPTQESTGNNVEDINIDDNTEEDDNDTFDEDYQNIVDALEENANNNVQAIEDATADLEEYNQQYIDEIKRSFSIRKAQMARLNKATLAGKTKAGIRAGRQRYATDINADILTAEESAGISRLNELDAQESMLIAEARMAMTEKKMDLLNKKFAVIKQLQEEKKQTLLDLRNIAVQEEERARANMRFSREKATWAKEDAGTRLEMMLTGDIDLDTLNDNEYTALENDLGLGEGELEGFYKKMRDAQKAEAVGDSIKLQKSILDLLNATPEGMEITIGDKTYLGTKDMIDRMSYTYIDGATNKKYEIVIDKKTGEELYRKDMGQAYKYTSPSGDNENTKDDSEEIIRSDIEQSTGEDGYVNPNEMKRIRQTIAQDEPGLLSWFDKAYPPKTMLNPDYYNVDAGDTWLKDF